MRAHHYRIHLRFCLLLIVCISYPYAHDFDLLLYTALWPYCSNRNKPMCVLGQALSQALFGGVLSCFFCVLKRRNVNRMHLGTYWWMCSKGHHHLMQSCVRDVSLAADNCAAAVCFLRVSSVSGPFFV